VANVSKAVAIMPIPPPPPRTEKTCSNPISLPFSDAFAPSRTVTAFSLPFHVPEGTTITIELAANLDAHGDPDLASVGIGVRQCCDVSDSDITDRDTIGKVGGPDGGPITFLTLPLPNKCVLASKFGDDFIYYVRIRIFSSNQNVGVAYAVRIGT
jgi:hypothetical protein